MEKTKKILLPQLMPQGFYDHLQDEANREIEITSAIIDNFGLFGYQFIRPSIMEFEDQIDNSFSSQLFKVTDPQSGRMMALRNDITPQISRIVKDRFINEKTKLPLRFSYSGQVFRKFGTNKYAERQLSQAGFELIADDKIYRDVEVIYITATTLIKTGLKDFVIDFNMPKFFDIVAEKIGLKGKKKKEARAAINQKNSSSLSSLNYNIYGEILEVLDEAYDVKTAIKALKDTQKIIDKNKISLSLAKFIEILQSLLTELGNINLNLNLFEDNGFSYHSGISYSFIARNTFEEVARGGRYSINAEKEIPAVGSTIFINSVLRSVPKKSKKQKELKASYKDGLKKLEAKRKSGVITKYE